MRPPQVFEDPPTRPSDSEVELEKHRYITKSVAKTKQEPPKKTVNVKRVTSAEALSTGDELIVLRGLPTDGDP